MNSLKSLLVLALVGFGLARADEPAPRVPTPAPVPTSSPTPTEDSPFKSDRSLHPDPDRAIARAGLHSEAHAAAG